MTDEAGLREQVAWGSRILAMGGHGDLTLGHLSARGRNGTVLIKRRDRALGEVTPDDVLTIDLEGRKVDGKGEPHLESTLHTAVYRARSDVHAVIHTHPPYTTALASTGAELELLSHDAVLFQDGLVRFEETAELITAAGEGEAVARALGSRRALLLQNHGVLVVGQDVPWAVYAALTLERAAMLQILASSLGRLRPMSPQMAATVFPGKYRDEFVSGYWSYLVREVRRQGLAQGMPESG